MGKLAPALTALALATALTACGSEAAPAPAPTPTIAATPTASPTPSASPTLTAPVMPEAAKEHTRAGAAAFAQYTVAALNYAFASLDTGPLERLSTDYCKGCRGGTEGIKKIASRRGVISGGRWTLTHADVTRLKLPGGKTMAVTITIAMEPESVTYPNAKPEKYSGGTARDRLVLAPAQRGWLIADWTVLP